MTTTTNDELAWKIFQTLKENGVIIGNASVQIIEKLLNENSEKSQQSVSQQMPRQK